MEIIIHEAFVNEAFVSSFQFEVWLFIEPAAIFFDWSLIAGQFAPLERADLGSLILIETHACRPVFIATLGAHHIAAKVYVSVCFHPEVETLGQQDRLYARISPKPGKIRCGGQRAVNISVHVT